MTYSASMRVWRGDESCGELREFTVEVNEGEVVLDVILRLQQTQTPDLAVRWNCKAGKCGSCSAEINGKPRLMCMTRMSTFDEDEIVTVTPTDVSGDSRSCYRRLVQLPKSARDPVFRATQGATAQRVPNGASRRCTLAGVPQVH